MSQERSRPERADRRNNRERIARAAAEIFAEQGVDVQMYDVAARAEVAVGTVYRHFATKEALVDALLLNRLLVVAETAENAAAAAAGDPWSALEAFLRTVTELQVADRSLSEFIGGRIPGSPELREQRATFFRTFSGLVDSAREAGALRPDLEATDIRVAMICVARAVWGDWPSSGWVLDRFLPVVLDGMRAPGHSTIQGSAPSAEPIDPAPTARAFQRGRRAWR